jgi:hypothetical protein
MSRLASIISITAILATPASAEWRDQEIDGSSSRAFERSVVLLLNELPRRRREEFEIALASIWIGNTVDVGDSDVNEFAELDEARLLKEYAEDLLTEIKRGDVLAAIEKREEPGSDYTSVEYVEQLDGLRFEGVVDLAARFGNSPDLSEIKREVWCRDPRGLIGSARARRTRCDDAAIQCPNGNCVSTYAARALDAALEALKAEQYADARAVIEALDFNRLTPYEQSRVEQRFAQIASEEQDYARMREHLYKAIYAGGLSVEEELAFRRAISRLDAQLSAVPLPE